MSTDTRTNAELLAFLLAAQTPEAMQEALTFLLTPSEIREFNNRLLIIEQLEAGVPQRLIAQNLGVAIATVSRGARALKEQQKASDHE